MANPFRKPFHPRTSFYRLIVVAAQIRYISRATSKAVHEAIKLKKEK
jgi:hypothetical protein